MTTPQVSSATHGAALALIDRMVEATMARDQVPGISLAITDRSGLIATRTYGFANLDAQIPVGTDTLFEIGSIGKSFTAVVFLQLAAEGVVDLHVPVETYLPWFAVKSVYGPITLHHLLTHTAGIIGGHDHVPDPRYELWLLRETRTYATPGEQFTYSNLGYKALGLILERLLQKPYAQIIQERIFGPLGMTDAWAEITNTMRPGLAVGYGGQFDDRPGQPWHRHVPATWLESNTGDGCISTHAIDLATYLRTLLNHGSGPDGSLLTADQFALMRNPHTGPSPVPTYGYALTRRTEEETHLFGHSGGMVGYVSQMIGDLDAGLGVVVLCNDHGPVGEIADFALMTMTAANRDEELPELPPIADPFAVANATDYAGLYCSGDRTLEVVSEGDRLVLVTEEDRIPLRRFANGRVPDTFVADHPDFALDPLSFGREGGDEPDDTQTTTTTASNSVASDAVSDVVSNIVDLTIGGDWYHGERHTGPVTFTYPTEWDGFVGHYRSHGPWYTNFRVGIVKGELILYRSGYAQTLVPEGDGFRVGKGPVSPEWVTFDAIVDGQALVIRFENGSEYARFFTP